MKSSLSEWQRLVAAARQAPDLSEAFAPFGFSTRVVARSSVGRQSGGAASEFARFSWRALGVAALVMALTVAANYQPVMTRLADDANALSDPMLDPEESGL